MTSRQAADWPNRPAVNWLNYQGDHTHIIGSDPLGPNAYGEMLHPVTADYDATTNRTRVGLTPIPPPVDAS